jgi:hypothetical protein
MKWIQLSRPVSDDDGLGVGRIRNRYSLKIVGWLNDVRAFLVSTTSGRLAILA